MRIGGALGVAVVREEFEKSGVEDGVGLLGAIDGAEELGVVTGEGAG